MAKGTKEFWSNMLPIIQAFIEGRPIEYLDYSGRWLPVEKELFALLDRSFRIRPNAIKDGVWFKNYTEKVSEGSYITGTQYWFGTNLDKPQWDTRNSNNRKFEEESRFIEKGTRAYEIIENSFNQGLNK